MVLLFLEVFCCLWGCFVVVGNVLSLLEMVFRCWGYFVVVLCKETYWCSFIMNLLQRRVAVHRRFIETSLGTYTQTQTDPFAHPLWHKRL